MNTSKFCKKCGNQLDPETQFCSLCGTKAANDSTVLPQLTPNSFIIESPKSGFAALLFCLFLGMFGVHRFYVGKIGTGLLMILTGGGFGIWVLIDLILIVSNRFEDKQKRTLILIKQPSQPKRTASIAGAILSWFALIVLTILAIVLYLTSGIVDAVHHQLAALQAGNIDEAYSYTSKDFQKATSIDNFKKFLDHYPSLKNNKSSFFNERKIENNIGTIKGTLTAKDGAKTPIEFTLIKEDGAWKIINIKLIPIGTGINVNEN